VAARIKKTEETNAAGKLSQLRKSNYARLTQSRIKNYELRMSLRDVISGLAGLATVAALTACNNNSARLSGHFVGAADTPVYLEPVIPGVAVEARDTVVTNAKGEFRLRVALPDGQPTIFNLRCGDEMIPLLLSPRERVNIMSLGNLDGYRVSGSRESELVWSLHRILSDGATALDSISGHWTMGTPDSEQRQQLARSYYDKYLRIKRQQIGFIVENSSSLAAVYALYQRLPGDDVLFNGTNDYVYYRMVADSVGRRYPDSRYVRALEKEVATRAAERDLQNRIAGQGIAEIDYPEVDLPNMYGQRVKLSSLAGKVIVLDFWMATDTGARLRNADMKELWSAYADAGLAIYQVSADTSRPLWVNAVQEQKLPWVTVCDFRGEATAPLRVYNVTSLPANFVIDRNGNIVGKNLFGDALEKKIKELL
jgi:peroxiredoxin